MRRSQELNQAYRSRKRLRKQDETLSFESVGLSVNKDSTSDKSGHDSKRSSIVEELPCESLNESVVDLLLINERNDTPPGVVQPEQADIDSNTFVLPEYLEVTNPGQIELASRERDANQSFPRCSTPIPFHESILPDQNDLLSVSGIFTFPSVADDDEASDQLSDDSNVSEVSSDSSDDSPKLYQGCDHSVTDFVSDFQDCIASNDLSRSAAGNVFSLLKKYLP